MEDNQGLHNPAFLSGMDVAGWRDNEVSQLLHDRTQAVDLRLVLRVRWRAGRILLKRLPKNIVPRDVLLQLNLPPFKPALQVSTLRLFDDKMTVA